MRETLYSPSLRNLWPSPKLQQEKVTINKKMYIYIYTNTYNKIKISNYMDNNYCLKSMHALSLVYLCDQGF